MHWGSVRVLVAALLMAAVVASFAAPATAQSTFTARVHTHPKLSVTITPERSMRVWVKFPTRFQSLDMVCLSFAFQGDLFDPGEHLYIQDFGGFINVGSTSQTSRTLCVVYQPTLSQFLDGKQRLIVVMESGSVRISSLTATATGIPK